jgi:MFS family permease
MRSQHLLVIAFASLSGFVMLGDFSALSVALPSIARQAGITPTALSLIGAVSTLMFASFLILGGRLTDLFGSVRICAAGLLMYLVGILMAASATGAATLIAARALGGMSFALLGPASFSMLGAYLPAGPVRDRAVGAYVASQGAAMIVGSTLGGALTTYFGWRVVFLMNVPTALVTLALGWVLMRHEPPRTRTGSIDIAGAVMMAAGTAILVWSLTKVGQGAWRSLEVPATLAGGLACYLFFCLYERSIAEPLVPRTLFRDRRLIATSLTSMCIMMAAAAMFILPNVYMQRVMGFSAAQSGLGMLPQALVNITTGGALAYAIGRFSFGLNLFVANATYLTGLGLFLMLPPLLPHGGYLILVCVPLVLSSFGGPFVAFALMSNSTAKAAPGQQGIVTSVVMTSQQLGLALGVAMVLTIAGSGDALGLSVDRSVRYAYLACFGAALLAALFAFGVRSTAPVQGQRANAIA